LAQTYSNVNDTINANLYFSKSIDYAKKHKLKLLVGINQFNYAVYLFDLSEFDKAYPLFEESKPILAKNDTASFIVVLLNEAKILAKNNYYDSAISICKKVIKIASKRGYPEYVGNAKYIISTTYRLKGDIDKALAYGIEYEKFCHSLGNLRYEKSAELNLLELYKQKSDFKSAFTYQKKYIRISDSIAAIDISEKVNGLTLKFKLQKQTTENDLLSTKNQMNDLKIKTQNQYNIILTISSLILFIVIIFLWLYYKKTRKTNSQLAELNYELIEKKKSLNEINNIQKNLFAIISHDLKGPIGTAKSFFDILNNDNIELTSKDRNRYVKLIGRSISSTYELLENVLFWSKNRMAETKPETEDFYPFAIVNEILYNIDSTLFTKEIIFRNLIDSNIIIISNLSIFKVVMRNLLTNAIKFTNRHGEILVNLEEEKENYWFMVKDNGIGIPPEKLSKLLSSKLKESTVGTENEKGTGLGLMISTELIEFIGGKLKVESQVGKGSTFSFNIKKQA